jgi:hypothetical protein
LTILQTTPWDVTLINWYIYLGLYTHKVGCHPTTIEKVTELARIFNLKAKELVIIIIISPIS